MSSDLNTYDIGDIPRLSLALAVAGVAQDPTTLRARVLDPDGTETIYVYGEDAELVRAGVGSYYLEVRAAMAGTYHYRFESTGTAEGTEEHAFFVRSSAFS